MNLLAQAGGCSFFVTMSIAKQLEAILSQRKLFDAITAQHVHEPNKLGDIKDAALYRNYKRDHVNHDDSSIYITFMFNTDGVRVFKSNHYDIWPVYLSVLEMPEQERFQANNMILQAVWHGSQKAQMLTLLQPFYEEMKELEMGVELNTVEGVRTVKAFVLGATIDLPARAAALSMINFNGALSCHRCYNPGSTFRTPAGGSVHVYDLTAENLRTDEAVRQDARDAIAGRQLKRGMKGPSVFSHLSVFSFCKGTMIDAMHGPFIGLQRCLLKLLFDVSNRGMAFSCYDNASHYSNRLKGIKPPMSVKRGPRGHYTHWSLQSFRTGYEPHHVHTSTVWTNSKCPGKKKANPRCH